MNIAPVALFVYNRPWHVRQTIEALQKNLFAQQSDLFIFSDAPKQGETVTSVQEVREFIRSICGFKSVCIIEREENFGLAGSVIDGVTRLNNEYGRVIVLEDDMITSPYFLSYMNEALERYSDDERVISIHGYVYPVPEALPEAFFLRGADCWGWATWQRGWALFNEDGQALLDELTHSELIYLFDFNNTYPYTKMLKEQIAGNNDSWAIRWYASAFLADKLTLYPGRSLVHNIGNDDSGTHCGSTHDLNAELSQTPINLMDIKVEASFEARRVFAKFFRHKNTGCLRRLLDKTLGCLKAADR